MSSDQMMKTCPVKWGSGCKMHKGGRHECYLVVKVQNPDGTIKHKKHMVHKCICKAKTLLT